MPKNNNISKKVRDITKKLKKLNTGKNRKKVVKAVVPRVINYIGHRAGVPPSVTSKVANTVVAHLNRIVGSGDYTISTPQHNSLIKSAGGSAPSFDPRRMRMTHREYICDITVSDTVGAFKSTQFVCNPTDATTFPFLSNHASLYEKYRFHGLVFEFISTVGQYSAGALGSVIVSSAFNSAFPVFVNKTQMENMENAISARTDTNVLYGVECKDQVQNWYYTKHINTTQKANTNVANMYDLADVSIATYGGSIAANTNVGELWVSYDVEFEGPRLPDQRAAYAHVSTTAGKPIKPLSSYNKLVASGTLGQITITSDAANSVVNLNNAIVGDLYFLHVEGYSGTAVTGIGLANLSGCEKVALFGGDNGATAQTELGFTWAYDTCLRVTAANATFGLYYTGGQDGSEQVDLFMLPVAFGIPTSSL